MTNDQETRIAVGKVFLAWLGVGFSQMTPLQWVQFIAAIAATVYSIVQTYKLLKGKK